MYDLIIIGGGPTGINIGVEAQKRSLTYLIIEKGMIANSIFHFPSNMLFFSTSKNLEIADIPFISHSDKPTRSEALEYYRRIVEHYQLNLNFYEQVLSNEVRDDGSFMVTTDKAIYEARNVVVSVGFYDKPRMLDIPGEDLKKVKHYYDEAHPYVGQDIVIVGAANSACDVALETWQKGSNVTMVIREGQLYPKVKYWILPNIENRIKEGSIKAYFKAELTEIRENEVDIQTQEGPITLRNDFVLAMTGYTPDYSLLDKLSVPIGDDEYKTPLVDQETLESKIPNLYVAGVAMAGLRTSKLFIENTRDHGEIIISNILKKKEYGSHQ